MSYDLSYPSGKICSDSAYCLKAVINNNNLNIIETKFTSEPVYDIGDICGQTVFKIDYDNIIGVKQLIQKTIPDNNKTPLFAFTLNYKNALGYFDSYRVYSHDPVIKQLRKFLLAKVEDRRA